MILGGAVTALIMGGMLPVSLTVDATAIVRPSELQTVCAPRDAVVDAVLVRHGESVVAGQPLVRMTDSSLDEQLLSLRGTLSVLEQKRARLTEAMVDASPSRVDQAGQTQDERILVSEEIRAVNDQLDGLVRIQESMVIRADRSGVVDAWQVDTQLTSRPVRRGDELLRIIANDSVWVAEARVPQNRLTHLDHATASVSLDSDPGQVSTARLIQIGPAIKSEHSAVPATAALLEIDSQEIEALQSGRRQSDLAGAPARVLFHCGTRPAVYVIFQDLIRWVRGTTSLYFAPSSNH